MPILLKSLILEGRYEVGVIIAKVKDDDAQKIMDFNYGFIPEQVLYTQEFNHGREKEPHITVKYGLTESYSPNQIQDILRDINPFKVDVRGISTFNNPKFDVVKFDVD